MNEASACPNAHAIHTIGHSTRTIERFVEFLEEHRINLLIDVRRWPTSRRFPHFHRDRLAETLAEHGIEYVWRQDLGGYRTPAPDSPNTGWRVGSFRAYADFMMTDDFARIMAGLEDLAGRYRLVLMCAEAVPWRCHRQLLADAFLVRGWHVRHILEDRCVAHELTKFARVEGGQISYREVDSSGWVPTS